MSANCVFQIRDYFIPNIKAYFIESESNPNGFNIRKMVDKDFSELI